MIQEDIILQQELNKYNVNKKLGNLLLWGLIINTIIFALLIWGGFKVLEMNQNMEKELHQDAFACAEYTSNINQIYAEAVANKLIPEQADQGIQREVKELKPNVIK